MFSGDAEYTGNMAPPYIQRSISAPAFDNAEPQPQLPSNFDNLLGASPPEQPAAPNSSFYNNNIAPQQSRLNPKPVKSSDNVAEMNKGFEDAFGDSTTFLDGNFSSAGLNVDAKPKTPFDFIQADFPTTPSSMFSSKHNNLTGVTDQNANASASFTANSMMDSVLDKATMSMNEMFISSSDSAQQPNTNQANVPNSPYRTSDSSTTSAGLQQNGNMGQTQGGQYGFNGGAAGGQQMNAFYQPNQSSLLLQQGNGANQQQQPMYYGNSAQNGGNANNTFRSGNSPGSSQQNAAQSTANQLPPSNNGILSQDAAMYTPGQNNNPMLANNMQQQGQLGGNFFNNQNGGNPGSNNLGGGGQLAANTTAGTGQAASSPPSNNGLMLPQPPLQGQVGGDNAYYQQQQSGGANANANTSDEFQGQSRLLAAQQQQQQLLFLQQQQAYNMNMNGAGNNMQNGMVNMNDMMNMNMAGGTNNMDYQQQMNNMGQGTGNQRFYGNGQGGGAGSMPGRNQNVMSGGNMSNQLNNHGQFNSNLQMQHPSFGNQNMNFNSMMPMGMNDNANMGMNDGNGLMPLNNPNSPMSYSDITAGGGVIPGMGNQQRALRDGGRNGMQNQQNNMQNRGDMNYRNNNGNRNNMGGNFYNNNSSHNGNSDRRNGNGNNNNNNNSNGVVSRDVMVEEFRQTYGKSGRQWELSDIVDHIVAFCQDQHGSRFIQQRLEIATPAEKQLVFDEIVPYSVSLMTDVFGNYVIQKLFEFGQPDQCESLAQLLMGQSLQLSMQMYGCRVIQKALEYVSTARLVALVAEFDGPQLLRCVHDQNGNHVIQKCIEVVSRCAKEATTTESADYLSSRIQFIITAFKGLVKDLSMHPYGCRVVQRILEHCSNPQKSVVLEELRSHCAELVQDQYGNYVIQHVMQHGWEEDRALLIQEVQSHLLDFSQHKFASNVVEKCLQYANKRDRDEMIWTIINVTFDLNSPVDAKTGHCVLESMVRDPYANYVVQKVIDVSDERQRAAIMRYVRENIVQLRRYTYGKHIIVRLEKITNDKF